MGIDETCATENNPWSIISSASTNSTLAGVLAAFLIAAIAVLFAKEHEAYVQTMALFASAIVILALDSYLFSHITGIEPKVLLSEGEVLVDDTYLNACARAWTQAMPASGMLATGGVALIAGLSWMLAIHGSTARPIQPHLATLGGGLISVVIITTTLLLTATTIQYLELLYQDNVNIWVKVSMWLGVATAIAYCVYTIWDRTTNIRETLVAAQKATEERAEAARKEAVRAEAARKEAVRAEAARNEAARAEAARKKAKNWAVARKWAEHKESRVEVNVAVTEVSEANATASEADTTASEADTTVSKASATDFTLDLGKLKAATALIAILAAAGPIFAGLLVHFNETWAAEPACGILTIALVTGWILPIVISICISHSVPNGRLNRPVLPPGNSSSGFPDEMTRGRRSSPRMPTGPANRTQP
ncbi:hypothetical protein SIM91_02400 [Rhodococcus opacus]|uniref:hypothetical protein n=1 Tax=Rhodococcus opacus TaxID=37919 RepID=UPI0007CD882C|nr:hypothetical protein [Rhodococcus opacus]MDX5962191.1 hypothetical protein [Rhodococcus opacus]NKY74796.1 hypothetical protein [Rhodococcus opacus]CAG7642529.1 hypothetical protein E143388_08410 [Rhodococcus opacus]